MNYKYVRNLDESHNNYAEWKKTDTKGYILYDPIYMKYSNRQIHRDNKQTINCQEFGGRMNREWLMGTEFFGGWLKVLKLDSCDGCTTQWIY